jgi:hypothetical protein
VTHDARAAAAADRVISLRDGLVVDQTALEDRPHAVATLGRLLELDGDS